MRFSLGDLFTLAKEAVLMHTAYNISVYALVAYVVLLVLAVYDDYVFRKDQEKQIASFVNEIQKNSLLDRDYGGNA